MEPHQNRTDLEGWLHFQTTDRKKIGLLGVAISIASVSGNLPLLAGGSTTRYASDFVGRYVGARLAWSGHLYDPERVTAGLVSLVGVDMPALHFNQLPFYAALISPLGWLPFAAAFGVWQALSVLAVLGSILWCRELSRGWFAVLCCWSYPLFFTLTLAQDTTFLLLVAVLCLRWHRDRPFAAGLLSALFAIKPHLFLLWPVLLIFQRRWRIVAGFLSGSAIVTAASFAVAGRSWPAQLYQVISSPVISPHVEAMPNLHGALYRLGSPGWLELMLCAAVVAAMCRAAALLDFKTGFACMLTGGILISFHAYASDCVLLIPVLAILSFCPGGMSSRIMLVLLMTPALYQLAWYGSVFSLPLQLLLVMLFAMFASGKFIRPREIPAFA